MSSSDSNDFRDSPKAASPFATQPRPKPQTLRLSRLEISVEREGGKPTNLTKLIDSDVIRIGSHPSNDLILADRLVSRFHCILERSPTGFRLFDPGSLNGTWISGIRVRDADIGRECRIDMGESKLRLRSVDAASETALPDSMNFGGLYGVSVPMRRLFQMLLHVAKSSSDVLIEGENGTGKEVVASEIVRHSARAHKPFVVVDCSAIAPNLIESELFGHVRGAFTGAARDRDGALAEADGGTVFLDEIGELPLEAQPKLLRALASREIRRVGENRTRKVDIRVIAATNRRLEAEVNNGRFREDLYYRLSVVTIRVPPLRERKDDLAILVDCFLKQLGAENKSHLFTPEVLEEMSRYDWPGNVRELRNFVERRIVFGNNPDFAAPSDPSPPSQPGKDGPQASAINIEVPFKEAKEEFISTFERSYLASLLKWADGNVSRAARKARIDRMYLHRLLQRYGFRRGDALE